MNEKHVPFGRLSLFTTFQANQRVQTARFLAACIGKKCDTSIVTYHLNACGVTTLYRTLPPSPLSHPSPYFFTLSSPLSHPPPYFFTLSLHRLWLGLWLGLWLWLRLWLQMELWLWLRLGLCMF